MPWLHFAFLALAVGGGTSFIDWFFSSVVFHRAFAAHPEIWRRPAGDPRKVRRILGSTLVSCVMAAAFAELCRRLHLHHAVQTLKLAAAIWFIAPLPLVAANALWMKLHPLVIVSQALCWFCKLALAALATAWLLR